MPKKVFISYRREDTKSEARLIHRELLAKLPRDYVFIDIDGSIPLGVDYIKHLENWIGQSDIVLAIIGKGWINATSPESGKRRLENSRDPVRVELRKALKSHIRIVPVFWDLDPALNRDLLPNDLKKLALLEAESIFHRSFDIDMERLLRRLDLSSAEMVVAKPAPSFEDRNRGEGRILVDAELVENASGKWFKPGNGKSEWFKDHADGPEMAVVPAGEFLMGTLENALEINRSERPQHPVSISAPFAVGRHAITREQFAAFVDDAHYAVEPTAFIWKGDDWVLDPKASWGNVGFDQTNSHPAVCVAWLEAKAYATWLATVTGRPYRLLSEAEREYVTRAGTTTSYWWGPHIKPVAGNFDARLLYEGERQRSGWRQATMAVGSFEANPWGLHDVHGNVWEWCEDVWHDNYEGAPRDGSAWLNDGDQDVRVIRGGSWASYFDYARSASRNQAGSHYRASNLGFRVARTLASEIALSRTLARRL